jgi:ribosomal-protein-alanine acetyltransferase
MIRPATASDLPDLAALEANLFGADAWDVGALRSELDGPGRRFVVAEAGELLGFAVSMSLGDVVDLQRIGVRPDQQRSGVATALLEDLVTHPGAADRMLLEVSAANRSAVAFYTRAGFSQVSVRPRYYRDGSDALVMQRTLVPGAGEQWGKIQP